MVTTFSNPKEMLGYKIIQDMQSAPDILKSAPYDRKAAWAYYYMLRHIHSQMISFHSDMFVLEQDEQTGEMNRYSHKEAYPVISQHIKNNWATVYSNQQDLLLEALFKFNELIASSFPKLGLVPESGEHIAEEERVVDTAKEEPEVIKNDEPVYDVPVDQEPKPFTRAELERIAKGETIEPEDSSSESDGINFRKSTKQSAGNGSGIQFPGESPAPVRKPTGYRFS